MRNISFSSHILILSIQKISTNIVFINDIMISKSENKYDFFIAFRNDGWKIENYLLYTGGRRYQTTVRQHPAYGRPVRMSDV